CPTRRVLASWRISSSESRSLGSRRSQKKSKKAEEEGVSGFSRHASLACCILYNPGGARALARRANFSTRRGETTEEEDAADESAEAHACCLSGRYPRKKEVGEAAAGATGPPAPGRSDVPDRLTDATRGLF